MIKKIIFHLEYLSMIMSMSMSTIRRNEYFNMHNGSETFRILITYKDEIQVIIYRNDTDDDNDDNMNPVEKSVLNDEEIMNFVAKSVLIGRGVDNDMTRFSGGVNIGENAFIFEINDLEYIYVGSSIYKFKTSFKLVEFYSALGNSWVVYPWAIDTDNNYYLMEEFSRVTNSQELQDFLKGGSDPYRFYYDENVKSEKIDYELIAYSE
jgi:hypothetical protein